MGPHQLAGGGFESVHRHFVHEDEDHDWAALANGDYSERERRRGRNSFVLRALDEQRSMRAFSELLSQLCASGAPLDVIGGATRIVRDEALHVELCGKVVDCLGGWPDNAPEPNWVSPPSSYDQRQQLLHTIIGSLCIGETVSVAMLAGVREHASDPVVHKVLTRMLADESFHSRFGWWWLERESATLSPPERRWIAGWLPRALHAATKAALGATTGSEPSEFEHGPFGMMSQAERRSALAHCITKSIIPNFSRCGFDVRRTDRKAA